MLLDTGDTLASVLLNSSACIHLVYLPGCFHFPNQDPFLHSSCKVLYQMHLLQAMLHQHHSAVEFKVHKKRRIITCRLKSTLWWLRLVMRATVGIYLISYNALNLGINVRYWQWRKKVISCSSVSAGDEQTWRGLSHPETIPLVNSSSIETLVDEFLLS